MAAIFGLISNAISIFLLICQMLVMQRRRKQVMDYRVTGDKVLKAFRKGSTIVFAFQFLLSGFILSLLWLFGVEQYKVLIPFRHFFFLSWNISVIRHWTYVFDPFGRLHNRYRLDLGWLVLRVLLGVVAFILLALLLISSGHGLGEEDPYFINSVIWSITSALAIASCLVFLLHLRRWFRSCRVAFSYCKKTLSDADVVTADKSLKLRVLPISYLIKQDPISQYVGYRVHMRAIISCVGYCIVVIASAVIQESLWFAYLDEGNTGEHPYTVFGSNLAIKATYYWLPELVPFVYWLWIMSVPKYTFMDQDGNIHSTETADAIVRTSMFNVESGEVSADRSCDVDTGSRTLSVQKSFLSRGTKFGSYLSWLSDQALLIGAELQYSPKLVASQRKSRAIDSNEVLAVVTAAGAAEVIDLTDGKKIREVHIACSEMILLDKLSDIPVGAFFSGQVSFIVFSVSMESDQSVDLESREWFEVGRSELQLGIANPDFTVVFSIPQDDSLDTFKIWRAEIYNVIVRGQSVAIPRFRVNDAKLDRCFLAGFAYFSGKELEKLGICGEKRVNMIKNEFAELVKPIISHPYDDSSLRFGGAISFRIRNVDLHCKSMPMLMMEGSRVSISLGKRTSLSKDALVSAAKTNPPNKIVLFQSYVLRSLRGSPHTATEKTIYIREECIESPYAIMAPIALLDALLERRTKETTNYAQALMDSQGHDDRYSENWIGHSLQQRIEKLQVYSSELQKYKELYHQSISFKSSAAKSNHELRYMPINLHLQVLLLETLQSQRAPTKEDSSDTDAVYIVTVGAFAAHSLKFKKGGVWSLMNLYQKRMLKLFGQKQGEHSPPSEADAALENISPVDIWHLKDIPLDTKLNYLAQAASDRLDMCMSQCISALVTGFVAKIQVLSKTLPIEAVESLCALGMLVQFESLLSTQGSEQGMLEDMYCTVRGLDCVQFRLHESNSAFSLTPSDLRIHWDDIEGGEKTLIIELGIVSSVFCSLPVSIQEGAMIPIVPVMFTVGINEFQTLANAAGSEYLHLQEIINLESIGRLKEYIDLHERLQRGALAVVDNQEASDQNDPGCRQKQQDFTIVNSPGVSFSTTASKKDELRGAIEKSLDEIKKLTDERSAVAVVELSKADDSNMKKVELSGSSERKQNLKKIKGLRRSVLMTDAGRKLSSARLFLDPDAIDDGPVDNEDTASASKLDAFRERDSDDEDDEDVTDETSRKTLSSIMTIRKNLTEEDQISISRSSLSSSHNKNQCGTLTPSDVELSKRAIRIPQLASLMSGTTSRLRSSNETLNAIHAPSAESTEAAQNSLQRQSLLSKRSSAQKVLAINLLFNELNETVGQSKGAGGKPWKILTTASKITQLLGGMRLTSCKSAKDRTGMSVTLEEATLVKEKFGLDDDAYKDLLDILRIHGVRIKNAEKNIGKAKFAFNAFQRQFLPDQYAPPLCAIGSVQS